MKNYLTIYLQYINGNPKISINIKAIYHSLKKVLPEKNRQINEDNFDKRKMFCEKCFWGCVSSRKSRIEKEK
jgi:hypothetical protein